MASTSANPTLKVGLTLEERKLYLQLFKALDPESSGIVTGEKARSTFEKSGLPPNILGEIWQLADSNNLGFLTQFGFCFAMRLIGHTQAGHYPTAQLADNPGPLPKFSGLGFAPQQLAPQSTNSSFLQLQPSAVVPQNSATQHLSPQDPIVPVPPADYQRSAQMFVKTTGSESTPLNGTAAKDILMKAKLPTATLGQVWSLVDVENRGFLDLPAFVMAMHLIRGLLGGSIKQLPPFLPEHVWQSVGRQSEPAAARQVLHSSIGSQQTAIRHSSTLLQAQPAQPLSEWVMSSNQKQQVDSIFDSLDKAKTGFLNPDQVASFLMTSRLDQQDLASIWDLADIQNTGVFSKVEFGIALFLVNRRRTGLPLPNVVPNTLIDSIYQQQQQGVTSPTADLFASLAPQQQSQAPALPEKVDSRARQTSSIDELADVFSSPSPTPASTASAPKPGLQQRTSSSDLAPTAGLPKVRKQLTSSFRPTSNFGQTLLANQPSGSDNTPSLIGEDVPSAQHSPTKEAQLPAVPEPQQSAPEPEVQKQKTIDYNALRSIPPPKPKTSQAPRVSLPLAQQFSTESYEQQPARPYEQQPASSQAPRATTNTDLLADSEVSGKLSEATSDIANVLNQIKSLTTQTSALHENKLRAEQELTRILAVKEEIDSKLKQLRASYANEVKQVEQVEATLATAKEETEALRSEASIAEAKLNHLSGELHEKQLTVEEHQKINSSLREKLGYLNAEIAELEKQTTAKSTEGVKLSNEANVRKSQVQVALVKVEEWKSKLAELEKHHLSQQKEIEKAEQDRIAAEKQSRELESQHKEFSLRPLRPPHTESKSSSDFGKALTAAAAGAAAIGAGIGFLNFAGKDSSSSNQAELATSREATSMRNTDSESSTTQEPFPTQAQIPGSLGTTFGEKEAAPVEALATSESQNAEVGTSKDTPLSAPGQGFSVSALVDEVQEHPTEDMTGVDDFDEVEHKEPEDAPPDYEEKDVDEIKERFPEVPSNYEMGQYHSNIQESASSAATESYKPTETGEAVETPVTSPDNSEYRFQSSGAGIAGGMVGMPGVLVGVQRTDSLTSSVQNNPPMSVRDDNIEEVSDRDTLDETAASPSAHPPTELKEGEGRLDESSEGERLSSGVELFEMVNADEARGLESQHISEGLQHPLAQSHRPSTLTSVLDNREEEFPPIKELDYDESSSDEEEELVEDKFDDAVDHLNNPAPAPLHGASTDAFDADFDDLKPTAQEKSAAPQDDFFGDEFNDLKAAGDDDVEEFGVSQADISMDDHFTGAPDLGDFAPHSGAPDFSGAPAATQDGNDEWEQLFAGFGNAAPAAPAPTQGDVSKDLAVEELVGMGFEKHTVVQALETENWNVEAATNYLLDHA